MNINPINLLLLLFLFLPMILGFFRKYDSENVKQDLFDLEKSMALFISIIISIFNCLQFDLLSKIIDIFFNNSIVLREIFNKNLQLFYYIIFIGIVYITYLVLIIVLKIINNFTLNPLLDSIQEISKRSSHFTKAILGLLFSIPKGIINIILLTVALNIITSFNISMKLEELVYESQVYNVINEAVVSPISNSQFLRQIPRVLNDSLKIKVVNSTENSLQKDNLGKGVFTNEIIYYNGVTLDEGIKSNSEINSFAIKLTRLKNSDKEKARVLYNWIGSNIEYDDNKANEILRNDFSEKSGAIPTFNTRKGICFDYSCLYVAMARASGLKVRIIVGEGYNGRQWVNHAWNQVFIKEENRWINVDTTFYKAGNYFDSKKFEIDHNKEKIAGEW